MISIGRFRDDPARLCWIPDQLHHSAQIKAMGAPFKFLGLGPPDICMVASAKRQFTVLCPKFDTNGLIPVVTTDAETGEVLMMGVMNAEALSRTIETGDARVLSRQSWEPKVSCLRAPNDTFARPSRVILR